MKCIFGMKINIKVFYKLILSFWMCATRHTQSTQNKFAYLPNISKKAWEMKLIYCQQINTSFLQFDSITVSVFSQAWPKYPKQQVYNIFALLLGKFDKVDFLPADKSQRFYYYYYYYYYQFI